MDRNNTTFLPHEAAGASVLALFARCNRGRIGVWGPASQERRVCCKGQRSSFIPTLAPSSKAHWRIQSDNLHTHRHTHSSTHFSGSKNTEWGSAEAAGQMWCMRVILLCHRSLSFPFARVSGPKSYCLFVFHESIFQKVKTKAELCNQNKTWPNILCRHSLL